ncbi:MAG: hypothetical protein M1819_005948 [Sarea resinae]|nr:MAG: hypothetical protein M1819_005948 [Sarea resinae]
MATTTMTTTMTTHTTPPPLQGPSSKERKYDRQLRLWAATGQEALEDAHILLVNSGPGVVGIETLKNLVLPGIGHFTILDEATVTEADLGVNFFLDDQSLGQSRAKRCRELLEELNPDVAGNHLVDTLDSFVSRPNFLTPFSLVLVTAPVARRHLRAISRAAQSQNTPVFYIHSVGFYSHFSLSLPPAFPIVETHPDPTSTTDLRLLKPWPELLSLAREKTSKLDALDDHQHGHVPYLLLLLHYLEQWKESHEGEPPKNYKEKTDFRQIVRKGARTNNAEGGEENYDEAVAAVLKSLNPPSLSSNVRTIFEADECRNLNKDSPNFYLIASAISKFHSTHAALPLPGSLPDMKAQSADYIALQNVYKAKARSDLAEVTSTVRVTETALGRTVPIDEKEIEAFCKGAAFVKLVRGKGLQIVDSDNDDGKEGEIKWGNRAKWAYQDLSDPASLLTVHIAIQAYDLCGGADAALPSLQEKGRSLLAALARENGSSLDDIPAETRSALDDVLAELHRAHGSELHNTSSLAGGMLAQEAIKIITKQYVPVDNTCVFDGVRSRTAVFRV